LETNTQASSPSTNRSTIVCRTISRRITRGISFFGEVTAEFIDTTAASSLFLFPMERNEVPNPNAGSWSNISDGAFSFQPYFLRIVLSSKSQQRIWKVQSNFIAEAGKRHQPKVLFKEKFSIALAII
jgi:hypothetical protein